MKKALGAAAVLAAVLFSTTGISFAGGGGAPGDFGGAGEGGAILDMSGHPIGGFGGGGRIDVVDSAAIGIKGVGGCAVHDQLRNGTFTSTAHGSGCEG